MLPLKLRVLKWADRVVGSAVAGWARPASEALRDRDASKPAWSAPPVPPEGIERILIIRPGGIGDAVLLFPMIAALRDFYRDATIDILGERRNVGVYQINDWVRDVYRYDAGFPAVISRLRRARYQIVIDTEQYHYLSTLVANHLRPRFLCGFDTLGRGRFHTHRVRYSDQIYEVYSFLALAAALTGQKYEFDPDRPFLTVDDKWRDWAEQTLAPHGNQRIAVIVPGASTPHKYWAPNRYAETARWLVEQGFFVVLLGGRDTLATSDRIASTLQPARVLNLAGKTSLAQTAAVVERATIYVSSDTGALHLAYGVGTPTVHMFGSGIMEKWAPQGRRYVVVNKGLPCSPCTRYGYTPPCPYNVACMDAIEVADVTAAIQEVLSR
jgi:ADP-heptose:LPS heptosyltransferase